MTTTANTLMGLRMVDIAAAFTKMTGMPPHNSKTSMVQVLARAVDAGQLTLADVRRLGQAQATGAQLNTLSQGMARPAPASAPSVGAATQARMDGLAGQVQTLDKAAAATAAELHSLDGRIANLGQQQQSNHARLGQLSTDITTLHSRVDSAAQASQAETKSLRAQVQALADSLGSITMPVDEVRAAMRQAVEDAWGPIRAAAEANSTQAQVLAQVAGPTGRASALDVFGIDARDARGRALMFFTWADTAPPVDACHIWTEQTLRMLALAESTGRNAWLAGPAGVGKSQTVQQYAARTGRAFERFQMHKLAGVDDFLGTVGLKGGDTQFQPGPILRAFTTPGSVCLIDEPATGSPAVMAVLNGLLEPGHPRISHGEKVYTRATGNLFFGADNSNGQGDTGGRFAGVQQMNTATMDRFSFVVPLSYLDPADEAAALVRHTGCTQTMADHVIQAFALARSKVETGDLIDPPTFRQAIGFVQACSVLPVAQAWQVTIAARQPTESQVALAAIYSAAIDETLITTEAV
jgi:MoxR-like ATPase/outer membrane murein-binding lipoprotein Lpp